MGDTGFIKSLIEFDKDNITPLTQKKLSKYIQDPLFLPELVSRQSKAATSLCMWVRAMDVYADVSKVVAPKKAVIFHPHFPTHFPYIYIYIPNIMIVRICT
jgi:dynein heavy chain